MIEIKNTNISRYLIENLIVCPIGLVNQKTVNIIHYPAVLLTVLLFNKKKLVIKMTCSMNRTAARERLEIGK